jgi:transcriptional regulator with XRE-family HTH domain
MSTLLEQLKKLRLTKGLTQEEFSKILGTNRATLANWETGRTEPDATTLSNIASFFNVSVDYLLGRETRPAPFHTEETTPTLSPDEMALIEKYRRMKDNEKDTMHKVADTIAPDDEQAAASGK